MRWPCYFIAILPSCFSSHPRLLTQQPLPSPEWGEKERKDGNVPGAVVIWVWCSLRFFQDSWMPPSTSLQGQRAQGRRGVGESPAWAGKRGRPTSLLRMRESLVSPCSRLWSFNGNKDMSHLELCYTSIFSFLMLTINLWALTCEPQPVLQMKRPR